MLIFKWPPPCHPLPQQLTSFEFLWLIQCPFIVIPNIFYTLGNTMKLSIKSCSIQPLFHELLAPYLFPLCLIWCYLQGPKKSWQTYIYDLQNILKWFSTMGCPTYIYGCKWDNTSHTCMLFYCFCDCFLRNIPRIFLKFLQKNSFKFFLKIPTILSRFMLKFWQKMSLSKKCKSIYKSFYCLKVSITMHNECFLKTF